MGSYSAVGIVRNTISGEPVPNALVFLERAPSADPSADPASHGSDAVRTRSTLSRAGGEFRFDGLPAGHYHCLARKPDFMPEDNSPENPGDFVVPGSLASELIQLRLTPYGAIRGTVVNQFGEPVEYALVVVFSVGTWDGERTFSEVIKLRTNNYGQFLVTRVLPGRYYVKVVGRDGGTETHIGAEVAHYAPWESFAPSYFGGAQDRESATPIEVASGSLVQTDFRVELQRAFRIRGKLKGYQLPGPVEFQLLQGTEPGEPQRAMLDGATGAFEIVDALPGTYTLRATQEKTRGETTVNVADGDIENASVVLEPGVTITGSTHVIGTSMSGSSGASENGQFPARCTVDLKEHRRREAEFVGIPQGDGQLTITDVQPGEYEVRVTCVGGYPLGASFGDIDLLANPIITISKGVTRPIEIWAQPGGGILKVRFVDKNPSGGAVLLVPASPTLSGPILRSISLAPSGFPEAIFAGLAPGEYSMYGLAKFEDVEFRNDAFLQSLSGGTTVRVEDGKTTEVAIEKVSR